MDGISNESRSTAAAGAAGALRLLSLPDTATSFPATVTLGKPKQSGAVLRVGKSPALALCETLKLRIVDLGRNGDLGEGFR